MEAYLVFVNPWMNVNPVQDEVFSDETESAPNNVDDVRLEEPLQVLLFLTEVPGNRNCLLLPSYSVPGRNHISLLGCQDTDPLLFFADPKSILFLRNACAVRCSSYHQKVTIRKKICINGFL
jgi:hypothetical protein